MAVDGITATYIAANQFSVTGNQTTDFHAGRRVKAELTGGDVYSTISGSVFGAVTTVTLYDSELDNTLTKVWYGIGWGSVGSLPDHTHDGSEGSGGIVTVSGVAHSELSELDYASSGHTGFASSASLADYLNKDGTTQLTGDWDFGSQTISGTGDIWCNDLHTAAGSLYIGSVQLTSAAGVLNYGSNTISGTGEIWSQDLRVIGGGIAVGRDDVSVWRVNIFQDTAGEGVLRLSKAEDGSGGAALTAYKSRGSHGSPSAVQANDVVAGYNAAAYDGSTFDNVGRIRHKVESISSGNIKAYIEFHTSDSSGVEQEMARLNSTGFIVGDAVDQQPDYPLQVKDSAAILGIDGDTATSDAEILLERQGTTYWHIYNDATGAGEADMLRVTADGGAFDSLRISNASCGVAIGFEGTRVPDATRLTIVADEAISTFNMYQYWDGSGGAAFSGYKARGDDQAAPTAVVADDVITGYNAFAYDGSTFDDAGKIRHKVESISAGNVASYIEILNSDTTGTAREVGRFHSTGRLHLYENGLTLANSSSTVSGTLRWTGSDFQGYDGSQWLSFTASGTTDHSALSNLDYASAGHTDFVSTNTTQTITGLKTFSQDVTVNADITAVSGTFDYVEITDSISEIQFTSASGIIGVAGDSDLILLSPNNVTIQGTSGGAIEFSTASGTLGVTAHPDILTVTSGIVYFDGHIRTTVSGAYDIGTLDTPFRDIYLTGGSVYLDSEKISSPSPGVIDFGGADIQNATVSGSGSTTFTGLTDTPSSYTGHAGKSAVVKGTEDGLEFVTVSGGGGSSQWSDHGNGIYYDGGNVGIGIIPDASDVLTTSGTAVNFYNASNVSVKATADVGSAIFRSYGYVTNDGDACGALRVYNNNDSVAFIDALRHGANDQFSWVFSTQPTGGATTERMRIFYNGTVGIGTGSTLNTNMTIGLTINQSANDDQIFALKSSDIAHGITGITETDTYFYAKKLNADSGGAALVGLSEINLGLIFGGILTTDDTTKTTGSHGAVILDGAKKSGTGTTSIGTGGNIVAMKNNWSTRWILNAEGDTWQVGSLFINETSNASMTLGITINQGANDDEILALKSSDVAHGMTSLAETDTFFLMKKGNADEGGVIMRSLIEGSGGARTVGMHIEPVVTDTSTSNTDGSTRGPLNLVGVKKSGTTYAALASDELMATFTNYSSVVWSIIGDGTTWQSGGATFGGNVGIGSSPDSNHRLNISGNAGGTFSNTQVNFSYNDVDAGGYLMSGGNSSCIIGGGVAWEGGSNWRAKDSNASMIYQNNGDVTFYCNTGLTPGNTFSPSLLMKIDASTGYVHIGGGGEPTAQLEVSGDIHSDSIYINDTTNANMTIGLTINQGANDNEALALKSSDVGHGMTDYWETDTYATLKKYSATAGGLYIQAMSEDVIGVTLEGEYTNDDTTKGSSALAPVILNAYKKSGTGVGAQGANANTVVIRSNWSTIWHIDEDGDTWQSGGATFGGDVLYGANTISGTGDIYCNDIYTASGTVYIGSESISVTSPGVLDFGGATIENVTGINDSIPNDGAVVFVLKETITPGTSSVNFDLPQTAKWLKVVVKARSGRSGDDSLMLTFNNDSSANYDSTYFAVDALANVTGSSLDGVDKTQMRLGDIFGALDSGRYTPLSFEVYNYTEEMETTVMGECWFDFDGTDDGIVRENYGGSYTVASGVTSMQLVLYHDDFADDSEIIVYGYGDSTYSTAADYTKGRQELIIEYATTSGINILPGRIDIEDGSDEYALSVSGTLFKESLSLSASTWYYVYAKPPVVGNVLSESEIELSTTAPTRNTTKMGYYHGSNPTWRCFSLFYSDSNSEVHRFFNYGNKITFEDYVLLYDDDTPSDTWTDQTVGVPIEESMVTIRWDYRYVDAAGSAYWRVNGETIESQWVGYVDDGTTANRRESYTRDIRCDSSGKIETRFNVSTTNIFRAYTEAVILPNWIAPK